MDEIRQIVKKFQVGEWGHVSYIVNMFGTIFPLRFWASITKRVANEELIREIVRNICLARKNEYNSQLFANSSGNCSKIVISEDKKSAAFILRKTNEILSFGSYYTSEIVYYLNFSEYYKDEIFGKAVKYQTMTPCAHDYSQGHVSFHLENERGKILLTHTKWFHEYEKGKQKTVYKDEKIVL